MNLEVTVIKLKDFKCIQTCQNCLSTARVPSYNFFFVPAPLVMDENKWEELSEVQTDYIDSARSEITDDTDVSYITVRIRHC